MSEVQSVVDHHWSRPESKLILLATSINDMTASCNPRRVQVLGGYFRFTSVNIIGKETRKNSNLQQREKLKSQTQMILGISVVSTWFLRTKNLYNHFANSNDHSRTINRPFSLRSASTFNWRQHRQFCQEIIIPAAANRTNGFDAVSSTWHANLVESVVVKARHPTSSPI